MSNFLNVLYVQYLTNLHRKSVDLFTSTLQSKLSGDDGASNFAAKIKESVSAAESHFLKGAESAKLKNSDWSCESTYTVLLEEVKKIAAEKREEAVGQMIKGLEKFVSTGLGDAVQMAMNEASPNMWKNILSSFNEVLSTVEVQLRKKAQGELRKLCFGSLV
jgi:hypothetical protein